MFRGLGSFQVDFCSNSSQNGVLRVNFRTLAAGRPSRAAPAWPQTPARRSSASALLPSLTPRPPSSADPISSAPPPRQNSPRRRPAGTACSRQAGGDRDPAVICTIQGGKVLIPKQVFPMLRQITVDGLATHMILIDLVRRKHPGLRGAFSHHGLSSCRRRDFFRRGAAWPLSRLRSGKRTHRQCVRSSTFQVTVSPGSKSKAAAKGRGRLA